MKEILEKTERLESFKVDCEEYQTDQQAIWDKFKASDSFNKENHVHYLQIENYLDKYQPLKTQKQIGKTIVEMFGAKPGVKEKYQNLEDRFLPQVINIVEINAALGDHMMIL